MDAANAYQIALQTLGLPGVVLLAAALVIRRLYAHVNELQAQLSAVQDGRHADARAFTQQVLELVGAQHRAAELMVKAIDGNSDATAELKTLLQTVLSERSRRSGR